MEWSDWSEFGKPCLCATIFTHYCDFREENLPETRQLGVLPMLGLWAGLCLIGALYATWQGYGGRAFAATLTAFAFYFLVVLVFAAQGVGEGLAARFGLAGGVLFGCAAFLAYLVYGVGTSTFGILRVAAVAIFVFVPLALAASAERRPAGAWQDFLVLAGVWVAVKFGPSHFVWPYPSGRLAYVFTVLLAVNVALAVFVLARRVDGIGYTIGWGKHWGFFVLGSFAVFACIAILLGEGHAVYRVCATVARVAFAGAHFAGDTLFYGLAGRVAVSRAATESAFASLEERFGGMVDGLGAVWIFTHHESGISELAVRDSGDDCGDFLWMDLAEDGIDFCFGDCACAGGYNVALFVQDDVMRQH